MRTPSELPFLVGWRALAECLTGLGIPISPSALETLRRRYSLPYRGRAMRGREVNFSPADVETWVRHLVGASSTEWKLNPRPRSTKRPYQQFARTPRKLSVDRHVKLALPTPLYAVTRTTRTHGEQVHRYEDGLALADTLSPVAIGTMPVEEGESLFIGYYRYLHARLATATDLRPPTRMGTWEGWKARTLVGALVRGTEIWRWIYVPGTWFGLGKGTRTRFLASNRMPQFEDLIARIRKHQGDVCFVAWTRREPVAPVTFEPWDGELWINLDNGGDGGAPPR